MVNWLPRKHSLPHQTLENGELVSTLVQTLLSNRHTPSIVAGSIFDIIHKAGGARMQTTKFNVSHDQCWCDDGKVIQTNTTMYGTSTQEVGEKHMNTNPHASLSHPRSQAAAPKIVPPRLRPRNNLGYTIP